MALLCSIIPAEVNLAVQGEDQVLAAFDLIAEVKSKRETSNINPASRRITSTWPPRLRNWTY